MMKKFDIRPWLILLFTVWGVVSLISFTVGNVEARFALLIGFFIVHKV